MNKKGQVLVLFIIILPVLLLVFALIVDTSLAYSSKIKGKSMTKYALSHDKDIKEYFKLNNINIKKINLYSQDEKKCAEIEWNIDSVFGSIIGIKNYNIKISECD